MKDMSEDVIHDMMKETVSMVERGDLDESSRELVNALKNFSLKNQGYFFPLSFIPQTQMFRLSFKGKTIDIPSNWSFFHEISKSREQNKLNVLTITMDSDDDLLDVLSQVCPGLDELTAVSSEGEVYLCVTHSDSNFMSELFAYMGWDISASNKAA